MPEFMDVHNGMVWASRGRPWWADRSSSRGGLPGPGPDLIPREDPLRAGVDTPGPDAPRSTWPAWLRGDLPADRDWEGPRL